MLLLKSWKIVNFKWYQWEFPNSFQKWSNVAWLTIFVFAAYATFAPILKKKIQNLWDNDTEHSFFELLPQSEVLGIIISRPMKLSVMTLLLGKSKHPFILSGLGLSKQLSFCMLSWSDNRGKKSQLCLEEKKCNILHHYYRYDPAVTNASQRQWTRTQQWSACGTALQLELTEHLSKTLYGIYTLSRYAD